jgi:capsular polysaccharide biosynthesis protein/Flp pilus assembly protein TadD
LLSASLKNYIGCGGNSIYPAIYRERVENHNWIKEIKNFKIPEPKLEFIQNAIITVPDYISDEYSLGGVYHADGVHVASSHHLRRSKRFTEGTLEALPQKRLASVSKYFAGKYIYLGWYFNHYGHFLLESFSRAWPLLEISKWEGHRFIFHVHDANNIAQRRYLWFFEKLGIARDRILFITQDTVFEQLIIPTQQAVLARAISEKLITLYRKIALNAYQKKSGKNKIGQKIYISRRFLTGNKRRGVNEQCLEQYFEGKGYRIIHPQFMPFEEQINCFVHAKSVAGCEGTGLHNVLFSLNCKTMLLISHSGRIPDVITQQILNNAIGCKSIIYFQRVADMQGIATDSLSYWIDHAWHWKENKKKRSVFLRFKLIELAAKTYRQMMKNITPETIPLMLKFDKQETRVFLSLLAYMNNDQAILVEQIKNTLSLCLLYYLKSYVYRNDGKISESINMLRKAVELDTNSCEQEKSLLLCGILIKGSSFNQMYLKEARELCEKVIEADPENSEAWFNLSTIQLQENSYTDSRSSIEKALSINPYDTVYIRRLALVSSRCGDYKVAINAMIRIVEDKIIDTEDYLQLSWYYLMDQRPLEAEHIAKTILHNAPETVMAYAHLARSLFQQGRSDEAREIVERGLELDRSHSGLLGIKKQYCGA